MSSVVSLARPALFQHLSVSAGPCSQADLNIEMRVPRNVISDVMVARIIHVTRLRSVGRVADHRHFPLSEHGPLPGVRRLSVSAGLASANKMRSPAFVSCLEFARLPPAFRRRVVFLLRNAVSTRA